MSAPLSPNYRTKTVQSEVLTSDASTVANSCAQILTYYQALGFAEGDDCWINTYDAGVYRVVLGQNLIKLWRCKKVEDGWKPTLQVANPVEYLRELGASGHNIQSYPNHLQGGLSNHHASQFTNCWYEIDDLPLEAQREKVRWLEKVLGLTATITVFSGGKSLHVYFTFDRPVDADTWTRLNRKLAIVAGGDPAICTLARAMRLPGMPRLKNEQIQEVAIESFTDTRHDPDEFEKALDSTGYFRHGLSYERWLKWRKNRDYSVLSIPESEILPKPPSNFAPQLPYDGSTIPLEVCLSKDDRELVAAGAGEGNRDNAGYKLARNLIGTADQLQSLGIQFAGDPRQLFEEYCSRCSPPLASRDIERIWRSASRGTPSASLPDEALQRCIAGYQHRQNASHLRVYKSKEISREEWLNRHKLQQVQTELANFLSRAVKRNRKHSSQLINPPKSAVPAAQPSTGSAIVPYGVRVSDAGKRTYRYEPGNLPIPEQWIWLGRPKITFAKKDRLTIYAEACEKSWLNVHDSSGTGSGKSHDIGKISLGSFPAIDQVFYLSNDAENPTTQTVEENFTRLITRHDGQKYDHSHHTPKGKPHVRRVKAGESPDILGNCPETQTFQKLADKGLPIRGGKNSPICESCPQFDGCGFISERGLQLDREAFLRAHPSQMPTSVREDKEAIAFWDEVSKIFEVNTSIRFDWMQMQQALGKLQSTHPELYSFLSAQVSNWHKKLMAAGIPRHGLPFATLRNLLSVPRFIAAGNGQLIDLLKIAEEADRAINSRLEFSGVQSPTEKQQWVEEHWNPNYFTLLFTALTGANKRIAVTIEQEWNFNISRPFRHHRRVADAMNFSIFADATLSHNDLALLVGMDKDAILPIEQEKEDFSNLKVVIVNKIGKCGQAREVGSEFAQQNRLEKLKSAIELQAGEQVLIIDFKKYGQSGYWFKDNRGSNAFKDANHLILIGSPVPNLGAKAAEYQAMTGRVYAPTDLTGSFGSWLHRSIRSEIVQGIGRLRAQHSDQPKTCWIVGDGHGEALVKAVQEEFPGCSIEFMSAAAICPEAAPKGEQRERALVDTILKAVSAGEKLTKASVAEAVGLSVSRVKQLAANLGGFSRLRERVENLVMAIEGKLTPMELSEDALWIAREYLPAIAAQLEGNEDIDVIEELFNIRAAFGARQYAAILAATPLSSLSKMLQWILWMLPSMLLREIRPDDPVSA